MPYLPTLQEYLEQTALLMEAYPKDTRITTKYSLPSSRSKAAKQKAKKAASASTQSTSTDPSAATAQPPAATLTLKTYNPASGITLKYETNKAAEVGRLVLGLGKIARGESVKEEVPAVGAGDVEMGDAPGTGTGTPVAETMVGNGEKEKTVGGGGGGKGKKKKGKR